MDNTHNLLFQETLVLRARPSQIRRFIFTPDRVLDYTPGGIEGGVFQEGRAIWCRGETDVTLIEFREEESTEDRAVVFLCTAIGLEPPFSAERIRAGAMFTLFEDWEFTSEPDGTTTVRKSWRDLVVLAEVQFPLEDAIRDTLEAESEPLVEKWNRAAAAEGLTG